MANKTIGLHELGISDIVSAFNPLTVSGKTALETRLSNPLSDRTQLTERQNELREMRTRARSNKSRIEELRQQLRDTEDDVQSLAIAETDPRHSEYYSQILWPAKSRFAWLNTMEWVNEGIVFFRTVFLPIVSILLPCLVLIAPLLAIMFLQDKPELTVATYIQLLNNSIKTAMPSVLGKPRFAGKGGVLEMGEQLVHIAVGVSMFVASCWSQISSAMSLRAVVADMRRRAESLCVFTEATQELEDLLYAPVRPRSKPPTKPPAKPPSKPAVSLTRFGEAWNNPDNVVNLLERAGHLDMLASMALAKKICFPKLGSKHVRITDFYHPGISVEKRVYNSIALEQQTHVILTGPNRGGKSTVLRCLGAAVLMAHTVGVVFARNAEMPVFTNIVSALAPQDKLDELSLFESEIEFAKQVRALVRAPKSRTFLMMDEIFHGTNAHDGVEASKEFLDDLYTHSDSVFSIISTHYMELPERYKRTKTKTEQGHGHGRVQTLCMDAEVNPVNPEQILYKYTLQEGINSLSSVREILRERGLISEKQKQCENKDNK